MRKQSLKIICSILVAQLWVSAGVSYAQKGTVIPDLPTIGRAKNPPRTEPAPTTPTQKAPPPPKTYIQTQNTNINPYMEPEDTGYTSERLTGSVIPLNIDRTGADVYIITETMIEEIKPLYITDILRHAPGLIIMEQGINYATVSIQGAPATQTTVMIDGISIMNPADRTKAIDLSSININMNSIERIEIVKTPSAVQRGYGASGGIINIITKKGNEKKYSSVVYADMLFNLENKMNGYQAGINFGGVTDTYKYAMSYNRVEEIGISSASEWSDNGERDGFGSNNFSLNFDIMPIKDFKSGIYINYTDFYKEYDNGGGLGADTATYKMKSENLLFGWNIAYVVGEVWEPSINLTYKYMNKKYINSPLRPVYHGNGTYNGQEVAVTFNNNFYIAKPVTFSLGGEYIYEETDVKEMALGNATSLSKKSEHGINVYAQLTVDLFDAWTTIISAKGQFYGEFGYLPVYNASTAYYIKPAGLTLKGAFGVGASTPSLYQKYDTLFGNTNLLPEESMSYQAGFSHDIMDGVVVWGGSWFENYYKNMITEDVDGKFVNLGKTHTYGVEATLRVNPVEFVSIYGSYTWLNAKYTANSISEKVPLMPEHSMTGGVIFTDGQYVTINANVSYMSDRPIYGETSRVLKQYYLLNTSVVLNATKNFQIYLSGTNLADTRYESTPGYGTRGLEIAFGIRAKM